MVVSVLHHDLVIPGYAGLRLTEAEYLELPDDGNKYELIDGVVIMSPSATPRHQMIAAEVYDQVKPFVKANDLGLVLWETDINLGRKMTGRAIVFRPEIIFIAAARASTLSSRISIAPDLVVEVVSEDSGNLDYRTKFTDYAAAGVAEYWIIDPIQDRMTFWRNDGGKFVELQTSADAFESRILPGFKLQLSPIRDAFTRL